MTDLSLHAWVRELESHLGKLDVPVFDGFGEQGQVVRKYGWIDGGPAIYINTESWSKTHTPREAAERIARLLEAKLHEVLV